MGGERDRDGDGHKTEVRRAYADLARGGRAAGTGCCEPREAGPGGGIRPDYRPSALSSMPADVVEGALGCGDPVTLAELQLGQTVLDLGSGGGMDCFLAAREVGEAGRVIGVDMTPEMVAQARRNLDKMALPNVEFRLGDMEHLPVADASVDVVLSNCAVNLSPDPQAVFEEAFRVLKPGGLLAVSDVILDGPMPEAIEAALARAGSAGSLADVPNLEQYVGALDAVGFVDVSVSKAYLGAGDEVPTDAGSDTSGEASEGRQARLVYRVGETGDDVAAVDLGADVDLSAIPRSIRANVRGRKPGAERT